MPKAAEPAARPLMLTLRRRIRPIYRARGGPATSKSLAGLLLGSLPMTTETALRPLGRLLGSWATEATHPALPGVVVRGTASIEWLEGERFLILRTRNDHPDFPDAISIIGYTDVDRVGPDARGSTASSESRLE